MSKWRLTFDQACEQMRQNPLSVYSPGPDCLYRYNGKSFETLIDDAWHVTPQILRRAMRNLKPRDTK